MANGPVLQAQDLLPNLGVPGKQKHPHSPGVLRTVLDMHGDKVLEAAPTHLGEASMDNATAKPPKVTSNCIP